MLHLLPDNFLHFQGCFQVMREGHAMGYDGGLQSNNRVLRQQGFFHRGAQDDSWSMVTAGGRHIYDRLMEEDFVQGKHLID